MALKPPPIGDVFQQINNLVSESGLRTEADRTLKALAQSALSRLDVVSREEFDAQAAILEKMRGRIAELEAELTAMTEEVEALDSQG